MWTSLTWLQQNNRNQTNLEGMQSNANSTYHKFPKSQFGDKINSHDKTRRDASGHPKEYRSWAPASHHIYDQFWYAFAILKDTIENHWSLLTLPRSLRIWVHRFTAIYPSPTTSGPPQSNHHLLIVWLCYFPKLLWPNKQNSQTQQKSQWPNIQLLL